jgi:hypothetical protein
VSFLRSVSSFSAIFIHSGALQLLVTERVVRDHQIRVLFLLARMALQICTQKLLLNLAEIVIAI